MHASFGKVKRSDSPSRIDWVTEGGINRLRLCSNVESVCLVRTVRDRNNNVGVILWRLEVVGELERDEEFTGPTDDHY